MNTGTVGILNVGAGDTKLSFDKSNPAERIRAARIVTDMIKRGYVLLVDVGKGKCQRVKRFDEKKCEYIIADFDPLEAAASDAKELEDGKAGKIEPSAAGSGKRGRGRPRLRDRAIPAESTRGVAVARTAGG